VPRYIREWSFTLVMGIGYVGIFNLWRVLQPNGVFVSAVVASAVLFGLLLVAWLRKYFLNLWEALLHFLVILDIFLEGVLIPAHESLSFYWCALAFAGLIIGYRIYLRRRQRLSMKS
jgi:hypothetical protein